MRVLARFMAANGMEAFEREQIVCSFESECRFVRKEIVITRDAFPSIDRQRHYSIRSLHVPRDQSNGEHTRG